MGGEFDEKDTVASKNRYCLTSPNSFSCGNLAPVSFKASDEVTMIGKNSGGGACNAQPLTMADGTLFQISGPNRISMLSNGSFYDVDKGVQVDHSITKIDNFYNRMALVSIIDNMAR